MQPESENDGRRPCPVSVFCSGRKGTCRALLTAAIVVVAAFFLFSVLPITSALRIEDGTGKTLKVLPLPDGKFVHHFTHSIHLSAVDEYFRVEGGKLRLYELRYDTTSVGMPSDGELGYRLEGGRFVLGMDRVFGRISIRVAALAGHGIIAAGILIPFSGLMRPEGQVVISGTSVPLIRFWR